MDFVFTQTNIKGGFWKVVQDKNMNTAILSVYNRFYETGRIEGMNCNWKESMDEDKKPHIFWDSDVAKWIEGASYVLAKHDDCELEKKVESIIDSIEKNQRPDGYYNQYYLTLEPDNIFTVRENHELYCAGHLMEAAIAYYYATGKDRFLKIMERYADLIYKIFIEEKSASFFTPGHEEIEIALLRMYKCTEKEKYLTLCKYFIDNRGCHNETITAHPYNTYAQDNVPVRKLDKAEGHAVRALYLYTSMAMLAKETKDKELLAVCERIFKDVTERKMYITGGTGSTYMGERFTVSYDLPNEQAYSETCASIALMFFAQKMLEAENKGIYADAVERAMYNGVLSGLSLDGKAFFYENPLEINLMLRQRNDKTVDMDVEHFPITQRVEVFLCSCCPPNINRVLSSIEQYIYHVNDGVYYVDQFMESTFKENGAAIMQSTEYPNNGKIKLDFAGIKKAAIRIPGWCEKFTVNCEYELKDGYIYVSSPQNIELDFEMKPTLYMSRPEVIDCENKVALMYGPVVYCAEGIDNTNLPSLYVDKNLNADILPYPETGLNKIIVNGYERTVPETLYS